MKSGIQIAQAARVKPVTQVAREAGTNRVAKRAFCPSYHQY